MEQYLQPLDEIISNLSITVLFGLILTEEENNGGLGIANLATKAAKD